MYESALSISWPGSIIWTISSATSRFKIQVVTSSVDIPVILQRCPNVANAAQSLNLETIVPYLNEAHSCFLNMWKNMSTAATIFV